MSVSNETVLYKVSIDAPWLSALSVSLLIIFLFISLKPLWSSLYCIKRYINKGDCSCVVEIPVHYSQGQVLAVTTFVFRKVCCFSCGVDSHYLL